MTIRFDRRSLLRSVGLSVLIYLALFLSSILAQAVAGYPPGSAPNISTYPAWLRTYTSVYTCSTYLMMAGYGALYAYSARANDPEASSSFLTMGGAMTAALVYVCMLLIGGTYLAFSAQAYLGQFQQAFIAAGVDPSTVLDGQFLLTLACILPVGLTLVTAVCGALGATGAAITARVYQTRHN